MPNILVVDDSATLRLKCVHILTAHGFTVHEAVDGEDALEKLTAFRPDVILLDVIMPKMNGFEVLAKIKKDISLKKIPVIMVTVKSEGTDIVEGLNSGADEYISKPYEEQELLARVNAMLRIKALYDDLSTARQTIIEQEKAAVVGQLMVGIHHELRNPLAAALSDAQILLRFFKSEGQQLYFITDIEEQLQRMKAIIDNIKVKDSIELEEYIDGVQMVKLK